MADSQVLVNSYNVRFHAHRASDDTQMLAFPFSLRRHNGSGFIAASVCI